MKMVLIKFCKKPSTARCGWTNLNIERRLCFGKQLQITKYCVHCSARISTLFHTEWRLVARLPLTDTQATTMSPPRGCLHSPARQLANLVLLGSVLSKCCFCANQFLLCFSFRTYSSNAMVRTQKSFQKSLFHLSTRLCCTKKAVEL